MMLAFFSDAQRKASGLLGTEFEACILARDSAQQLTTVNYSDHIAPLLQGLVKRFGWSIGYDRGIHGETIALERAGAAITLEPGGQLELSGAPLSDAHASHAELVRHQLELDALGREHGLTFLACGFHPFARRDEVNWMPKGRYAVMREYLPKQGALALDMMLRTCTVQVNLDYPSEVACGERFSLAVKASSILTAIFANSPHVEGKSSGYRTWRSRVWQEVDPVRCGLPELAFSGSFSFERYVDWALATPMFFVKRDGEYHPYHKTFAEYLRDGFVDPQGFRHQATKEDWQTHLSTLFPEVRLKPFLEIRGADAGRAEYLDALPALCKGLFYDDESMAEARELIGEPSYESAMQRWEEARREGLKSPHIRSLAQRLVALSKAGLERANLLDANGRSESIYLELLSREVDAGMTQADRNLIRLGENPGRNSQARESFAAAYYFAGAPPRVEE
jgi:glutamate--cysteine ligase